MPNYGSYALATIKDGEIPETRMHDARQVQDFVRRLIDNDDKRSYKRSRVSGLVDGNPPYQATKLREAGRADACNVNWGTGRMYLESGSGAFYDLLTEAPGIIGIQTSHGNDEERERYSGIMREEADRILRDDDVWDFEGQQSINEMVLHGCGPLMFEDAYRVLPRSFACNDLKVPEFTKSDTHYWEVCMVQAIYYPPELYDFIRNADAASRTGWDVEYTKTVIENAMDIRTQPGIQYEWEFYQQELKNNSLAYYDDSKVCRLAHVFWKEFDGRITHAIVERDDTSGTPNKGTVGQGEVEGGIKFLFQSIGRYDSWGQCVHPMYFDRGNGGYHHSVTGLGVKMYSAMNYENRLLCNLMDKTFAPKILFKPTSTEATQRFQLAHHGDYGLLPNGYDAVQNPMAGLLTDGLAMYRASSELMQSNLSSYRQQVPTQESGNPPTKFQKQLEASQQSSLSKTTFNRYYKQLDLLYAEIVRRLCNLNSTDERAQKFQKRCEERGVPRECFGRIEKVEAIRVIGQGSTFMRKMAVDSLLPIAGALPEEGRDNLISDKIAAEAGQSAVTRYYPNRMENKLPSDQQAEALQWVAAMKTGVPPIVTDSQNHVTYAATFLTAATQALQSLKQGGNPAEVLRFVEIAGPAIAAQLERFANDPLRAQIHQELQRQWQELAKAQDQLKKLVQEQAKQQQTQQQKTQTAMTDAQIKAMKAKSDIQIKQVKTQAQLQQSALKHRQQLALNDAQMASEIHRKNRLAAFQE